MAKRSYQQYCGVARALDVLGERWTLLVVRDLLLGPRRFGELAAQLPGIGTDLLTARLRTLQDHGLVERHEVGGVGAGIEYALTPEGERLRPLIHELARVGFSWLDPPTESTDRFDLAWALSTASQYLDPTSVPATPLVIAGSTERFVLAADGDRVDVRYAHPGEEPAAPVIAGADLDVLAVLTGHVPFAGAPLVVTGDRPTARRWATAIARALPTELTAAPRTGATRTST